MLNFPKSVLSLLVIGGICITTNISAQLILKNGASVKVSQGTQIQLSGISDSLSIQDSSDIQNNGRINFINNAILIEQNGNPIIGTGFEYSEVLNTINNAWYHPGNLGFEIKSDSSANYFQVKRFHSDTLQAVAGINSILRYFTISSDLDTAQFECVFHYDSTELNSLNESQLSLINIRPTGLKNYGGTQQINSISSTIDSLYSFTLSPTLFELNPGIMEYCAGDNFTLPFVHQGIISENVNYNLWLTNGTDSILISSVDSTDFNGIIPDTLSGGNYLLIAQSNEVPFETSDSIVYIIHSLPNVTISDLPDLCNNINPVLLNGAPSNGVYSGIGVTDSIFDPTLSGAGNFLIHYTFTDSNNCTTKDSTLITVHDFTPVDFPTLNSLCENNDLFILTNATPSGGNYSGIGVNSNNFDVSISGVGNFILDYTFTDTNGCIDSDTSQITVHPVDSVSFTTLNDLCENAPILNLNQASPMGGNYSGVGVSSNNFDPSIGVGNYFIHYSFTNSFGCTDTDSSSINVLDSPNIPFINQNINLLTSDLAFDYQWYYNGNALSGETNQTISPLLDGYYFVEVFNSNGCSEFSDSLNFIFNTISENENSILLDLFPNPANEFIRFSVANHDLNVSDFTFTDINGKLITFEIQKNSDGYVANLQGISSGVYILNVQNENLVLQKKFTVIHP